MWFKMGQATKDILIGLFVFVLFIVLLYYLWRNNIIVTIAFFGISAFLLLAWTNKEEKFVYFAAFILGTIIDITLVPIGVWIYGNPTIFSVPIWLPFAYGVLTVTAIKIGKALAKFF